MAAYSLSVLRLVAK